MSYQQSGALLILICVADLMVKLLVLAVGIWGCAGLSNEDNKGSWPEQSHQPSKVFFQYTQCSGRVKFNTKPWHHKNRNRRIKEITLEKCCFYKQSATTVGRAVRTVSQQNIRGQLLSRCCKTQCLISNSCTPHALWEGSLQASYASLQHQEPGGCPNSGCPLRVGALLTLRSGLPLPNPARDQVMSPENGLRYVYVYICFVF